MAAASGSSDRPLNDYAQAVITRLGQAAPAQQAFLGKFMLSSAATGAGAGTGMVPTLSEAGAMIRTGAVIGTARVGQLPEYWFAQGDNKTVASGLFNSNDYLRIGMGFDRGSVVFRVAIGSKREALPAWVPGTYRGAFHINLWRF